MIRRMAPVFIGKRGARAAWLLPLLLALVPFVAESRQEIAPGDRPPPGSADAALVLDGRFVHNVGELHMNVTNWGLFGSTPNTGSQMSEAPSAQWPAGSGVEYLWSAGLWVGARVAGIPRVSSTSWRPSELRPLQESVYTIYRSYEGARGGSRPPSPNADDDRDGAIDEDPLDGLDNDGDGKVDEDYAAISNQMFHCRYRDDLPESFINSPDHQPLNVEIIQESYQWENDAVDDFVGVEFTIYNRGEQTLEDFFLAFYADPDVGGRHTPQYHLDDLVDYVDQGACVRKGSFDIPVRFVMGIAYDQDGDLDTGSPALGHIGIMFLGHTVDPSGIKAPTRVGLRSWQSFSGNASFEDGGDPSNDLQAYQLMSATSNDRGAMVPRDYRMLLSAGPFLVESGDSLQFQVAFVVGLGREGLLDNAAQAKLTFDGNWFNVDGDASTGVACNETEIYAEFEDVDWASPCPWDSMLPPITIRRGERAWVNNDCGKECDANIQCNGSVESIVDCELQEGSLNYWCTGVHGKEQQIHWLYGSPPPGPNLRVWATEGKNVLFWDNFSETVPDVSELIYDFEGYRIWRADNWQRPFGSSVDNGPSSDLWMLVEDFDIVNGLGLDRSLDELIYQPNVDANLVAFYSTALIDNPAIVTALDRLPPPGFTLADADTAISLAKYALGLPGGKIYYRYEDERVHTGMHYFYSITAVDHVPRFVDGTLVGYDPGLSGDPSSGFVYAVPQTRSQTPWDFDEDLVYVVPNPASFENMRHWALGPNNEDPTGLKIEFRHLPAARCTIRVFTLGGDLVRTILHDASERIAAGDYDATGTANWDLVSRNGQDVASGVYLYSVEAKGFANTVGKFVIIR